MKRYLSPQKFGRVSKDFEFLFKRIRDSRGELDLRLREGYFSLYYKGNSLAKVTFKKDEYIARIHKKFATDQVYRGDNRFAGKGIEKGDYLEFRLNSSLLHPFFQKKYLDRLGSNITRVNYSEEITFEQMLITDNLNREDFILIDRQVTETSLRRKRIDLLGLRRNDQNRFQFLVIEVKLGNNPELRRKVADQLESYEQHINQHFDNWKASYEITYQQMKRLSLFELPNDETIQIISGVESMVAVGGYSGIAEESIAELRSHFPGINVNQFKYWF